MWTTTLDPYAEELDACAAILDALLESGADVDAVDRDGSTALHRAVEIKHADAIDRILAKGASLTQSGKFIGTGNTALHHATRVGDTSLCRALCSRTTDLSAVNHRGESPLLIALLRGDVPTCELLLECGASACDGLTGGVALGNAAVHWDHLGQTAIAARLFGHAASVLRHAVGGQQADAPTYGFYVQLAEQYANMMKRRAQEPAIIRSIWRCGGSFWQLPGN